MIAEKGNKVYTIDESMKARYEADGFDIKDDSGKLISNGKGKTVSYAEYQKVVDELNALKAKEKSEAKPKKETKPKTEAEEKAE